MFKKNKNRKKIIILWPGILCLLLIFGTGCKDREKTFAVGIVIHVPLHLDIMEGFKSGMTELGYIDGENIRYIYNEPVGSSYEVIDNEIRRQLAQDVDLILTTGNEVSLRAKKAVEGTDMPVVAASVYRPLEINLIENLGRPGGNVTGVWVADTMAKLMELLQEIVPGAKKVYLPYNPDDQISAEFVGWLEKVASQMEVKLVLDEVDSVEEAVKAIETLHGDIDVIYRIPSPTLDERNDELSQAAIKRGIPMASVLPLDESVLITLAVDFFKTGRQAALLVHEIKLGAKPAEFPMASSDLILTVNIKTAEEIGIHIPDDILLQATNIIR